MAEQLQFDVVLALDRAKREVDAFIKDAGNTKITPTVDSRAAADVGKRFGSNFASSAGSAINNAFSGRNGIFSALAGGTILAGLSRGFASSVTAARDFESAFTGVLKTVDGLDDGFGVLTEGGERLRGQFVQLSKEIPVTFEELSKIGELGGQLGVAEADLVNFTDTIAKIAVSTNLTTERAATDFAKIANVLGDGLDQVDEYGSAIVALGNNFATTEADISEFSKRIAPTGNLVGLAAADIFAIGTAFSATGAEAEAGGTAIQQVLSTISNAVEGIGKDAAADLSVLAAAVGQTEEEFTQLFREDAAEAFVQVIEGIGEAGAAGGKILGDLGLNGVRVQKTFLAVAGSGDLLRRAVEQANVAYEENNALTDEAQRRFATVDSQVQILRNNFRVATAAIGSSFLPAINDAIDALLPLVEGFATFAENNPRVVLSITAVTAALGGLLVAIPAIVAAAPAIGTAFTIATGPVGIAIAGVVAGIALLVANAGRLRDAFNSFRSSSLGETLEALVNVVGARLGAAFQDLRSSISDLLSDLQPGLTRVLEVIGAVVGTLVVAAFVILGEVITNIVRGISELIEVGRNVGNFFRNFGKSAEEIAALDEAAAQAAENTGDLADAIKNADGETSDHVKSVKELFGQYNELEEALGNVENNFLDLSELYINQSDAADDVADAQQELTEAIETYGEGSEEAIDATNDLIKAENDLTKINKQVEETTFDLAISTEDLAQQQELVINLSEEEFQARLKSADQAIRAAEANGVNTESLEQNRQKLIDLRETPKDFEVNLDLEDNATVPANTAIEAIDQKAETTKPEVEIGVEDNATIPADGILAGLRVTFGTIISQKIQVIQDAFSNASRVIGDISSAISSTAFSVSVSVFESLSNSASNLRNSLQRYFTDNPISISGVLSNVRDAAGNFISNLIGLAEGGLVPGGNNVPTLLNDGRGRLAGQEFVVNAPATRSYLPFLEMINRQGLRGGNTNNTNNSTVNRNSNNQYNNYGGGFGNEYPYAFQNSF